MADTEKKGVVVYRSKVRSAAFRSIFSFYDLGSPFEILENVLRVPLHPVFVLH
jgi:hypothetical protein